MAQLIFRGGGIPVLASLASDISSPSLCTLVVKHVEAQRQATIALEFSVSMRGFDDEQPVHLMYDADNLVPGVTALGPATACSPQDLLDQIVRNKGRDLQVLSLHLKTLCAVRCPRSADNIAPRKAPDTRFDQLVGLAKATRLHILFDHEWLNPTSTRATRFREIVTHPELFSAFHAERHPLHPLRQTDWTVFSPGIDGTPEAPPPAYEDSANKRPRETTSSLSSPPSKRLRDAALSPTEKATQTTADLSPRASPPASSPNFQEAVNQALVTLLPDVLQAILPDMVARLLTVPPSSPSPSATTSNPVPQSSPFATLHGLIRNHAETLTQEMTEDFLEHTTDLRITTQVEFQEDLDDHKVDVAMLKEDGLRDINRLFDDKLEEFRESATGIVESVDSQMLGVYDAARERLNDFVKQGTTALAKEREYLEQERMSFKQARLGQGSARDRSRRAPSLPLGI